MWRGRLLMLVPAALLVVTASCSSSNEADGPSDPTSTCERSLQIDRFKELEIVDEAVVGDARSLNSANGHWSFRYLVEQMTPPNVDPGDFVMNWLTSWATTKTFRGYVLDRESRETTMQERIICPWLQRSPANGCDSTCGQCTTRRLDLAQAPFRLLAIANRVDLGGRPGIATQSGEGRFVFGLVHMGAGDDPNAQPAAMSVIFEYALPGDATARKEWANAWHALGSKPQDESYRAALQAITDRFASRGANPLGPNGSALSQIRTNESALNWIWQLREFHLSTSGLELAPLLNTPAESLNGTDALATFVKQQAAEISADRYVVPQTMLSASIDQMMFRWEVPGVDETTRRAFSQGTCNGCHSEVNPSTDVVFHVSPFQKGRAKLSPFVNDPARPESDDLGRRERILRTVLCAP